MGQFLKLLVRFWRLEVERGAVAGTDDEFDAGCAACRDGTPLPFTFTMAFQPILDLAAGRVWGYEALVRGTAGEPAGAILSQVTDETRYRFDQAAR